MPTLCGETAALIACYAFDNDVADGSGNAFDLGVTGPKVFKPGKSGQAFQLTGDLVKLDAASFNLNAWKAPELTIEAWVYLNADPPAGGRFGVVDNNSGYSVFIYETHGADHNVVRCDVGGIGTVWTQTKIQAGAWAHIACVFGQGSGMGKTQISAYFNGQPEQSTELSGTFNPGVDSVFVGSNDSDGANVLDGLMDNLRVFHTARTQQEICLAAGQNGC
jgi:Concanavalin A-like lectin/glucanases superfamily